MQPEQTTINLICDYGNTNLNKELTITGEELMVKSGQKMLLQIPLRDITSAKFSAHYLQLVTTTGNYVIRGIKPHDYNRPLLGTNSFSDPKSLKKVRSFFDAKGIKTSFQFIILDKNVIKVAAMFVGGFAVILAIILAIG